MPQRPDRRSTPTGSIGKSYQVRAVLQFVQTGKELNRQFDLVQQAVVGPLDVPTVHPQRVAGSANDRSRHAVKRYEALAGLDDLRI